MDPVSTQSASDDPLGTPPQNRPPKFRTLFNFSKRQVDEAFKSASLLLRGTGITVLATPVRGLPTDIAAQTAATPASGPSDQGKLLVIIPKKSGKAHDRNHIRRQLRSIFYEQKMFTAKRTYIIFVYAQALGLDFDRLRRFMQKVANAR